jgi:hypothetical protein
MLRRPSSVTGTSAGTATKLIATQASAHVIVHGDIVHGDDWRAGPHVLFHEHEEPGQTLAFPDLSAANWFFGSSLTTFWCSFST